MAKIRIKSVDELVWLSTDVAAEEAGATPAGDGDSAYRMLHPGSATELQLFEVRLPPNTTIPSHAHVEDEIIYIKEGSLHVGATVLTPGSSIFVVGGSLYTFHSGPEGLTFLNFRAHEDLSFISQEEVVATKRAERAGGAD